MVRDVIYSLNVSLLCSLWDDFENYSHCLIQFSLGYHVTTKCVCQDLRLCSKQWHALLGTFPASCCLWHSEYVTLASACLWPSVIYLPGLTTLETQPLPSIPGIFHSCGSLDGSTSFTFVDNLDDGLCGQVHPSWTHEPICVLHPFLGILKWPGARNSSPICSQPQSTWTTPIFTTLLCSLFWCSSAADKYQEASLNQTP